MSRIWIVLGALAACAGVAACEKPEPDVVCRTPLLKATQAPGTYAAEKEAALICVKSAAFALAKAGGPLDPIPAAAVAQCSAQEKAIGQSGGTLYDWQRQQLHESFLHAAKITAAQARSMGCGAAPGAARDTV
ncbi:MAG TPA: hypothetical protein VG939_22575 [Caulobacteraceae bacterium]|nr:hypothetical protein [Caulobacteraceae bacterium]